MLFDLQLSRIEHRLVNIEQKVDAIMAAQDDIAAAVAALNTANNSLTSFLTDLSSDVAAIKAAIGNGGTPVDTTALNAAVASFNTTVGQLPAVQATIDALAPPATTPPPVSSSAAAGQFRPAL
jgi:hypothetical protein